MIVHQRTEVLHLTVVVGVHHGRLDHIEPGADGVRDDILQDHHDDSSSRDLVTNELPCPDRQKTGETSRAVNSTEYSPACDNFTALLSAKESTQEVYENINEGSSFTVSFSPHPLHMRQHPLLHAPQHQVQIGIEGFLSFQQSFGGLLEQHLRHLGSGLVRVSQQVVLHGVQVAIDGVDRVVVDVNVDVASVGGHNQRWVFRDLS